MNSKIIFLFFIVSKLCLCQNLTFSSVEGKRFRELNRAWATAKAFNTKEYYNAVIDSIDQFLNLYPSSVYKVGVFNYKLDLLSSISTKRDAINTIADSILYYDSLAQAKLGIAEVLIQKNIDQSRGASLIREILPILTFVRQQYLSLLLLAKCEIAKGNFRSAKNALTEAIRIDSTRYEAWFNYLSLLHILEDGEGVKVIEQNIENLEKSNLLHYTTESASAPNLFKNINSHVFTDMRGDTVKYSMYENKIVVINCFAFWCGSCVNELPILDALSQKFPEVVFLYLNCSNEIGGNPVDTRKRFLTKPQFRILKNKRIVFPMTTFYDSINITAVPTTFIIDKNGSIRFEYLGYVKGAEELYKKNILTLLNEK